MKKAILLVILLVGILSLPINRVTASTPHALDLPAFPEDEILYGDANNDGTVNVLDIIVMISYIMGGNPNPFNFEAADVNNDGAISVLDIIFNVNIIMEAPGMPCAGLPTVLYEGQTYNTVQIGDQCWFQENLNVGTMILSNTGGQLQTNNNIIEKFCYDNNAVNCNIYGGLYEWNEAMQYVTTEGAQGICPAGWHTPTNSEWSILTNYLGGEDMAGGKMKSTGTIEEGTGLWHEPNTGATNSSGFTGLPGGFRGDDGDFGDLGYNGYFWTTSQYSSNSVWFLGLYYTSAGVYRSHTEWGHGFSVRCLKGCLPDPTQSNAGPDQLNVPGTSTTLAGNTPTYGTGLWTIASGTGGTILTPTNPNSGFQGVAGNEYTLSWTITTVCGSSADQVVISFAAGSGQSCPGTPTVEYEGQTYNTVQIGDQCWLKENLNVGTMIISNQGGYQMTDNGIIEKYCYNNVSDSCEIYGGLYEWTEGMQYVTTEGAQGICPSGWHIPTDYELKILEGTVDSQYPVGDPEWDGTFWRGFDAGSNLKEEGTEHWMGSNSGATNSSGFTLLGGGGRADFDGSFYYIHGSGEFWSSSQDGYNRGWRRTLFHNHADILRDSSTKYTGLSIRCLKN